MSRKHEVKESEPKSVPSTAKEEPGTPEPPATPELGPVVGKDGEPAEFESVGSQTGVQPLEADDIPEAGQ